MAKVFSSEAWDEFSTGIVNLKEKINDIIDGTQVVAKSTNADKATSATKATNATSATYATTAKKAESSNSASTATVDSKGQAITGYIKDFSINGKTITITKGDGTTAPYTTQDTNTTYSYFEGATADSASEPGLVPRVPAGVTDLFLKSDGAWSTPSMATSATKATSATVASTAAYAEKASSATKATTATNAGTATYAEKASSATKATTATKAGTATYATNAGTAEYAKSAGTSNKLTTYTIGSATRPIFLNSGTPTTCTYELNKTVPADAKFTDTVYTHPTYEAKTGFPTNNQTPGFGSTFAVTQPVSDATGHIVGLNRMNVTIPNNVATTSTAGLMSATDKIKLNSTNVAFGTCTTAPETAAKVVTITGNDNWTLTTGAIVTVKFSFTNTAASPTLNVNGTGAKSIYYNNAVYTSASSYGGYANRSITYQYDGTYWVFISWSYDSNSDTKVTQGKATTAAIEYPILLGYSASTASVTNTVNKSSNLKYNPNTKILTVPTVKGNLTGLATSATSDANGNNIANTYATKSSLVAVTTAQIDTLFS